MAIRRLSIGEINCAFQWIVIYPVDTAIYHWNSWRQINNYPADKFCTSLCTDRDLSSGKRYPGFEQLGPVLKIRNIWSLFLEKFYYNFQIFWSEYPFLKQDSENHPSVTCHISYKWLTEAAWACPMSCVPYRVTLPVSHNCALREK